MGPRGWHERGYLPHFDGGMKTQFLTYRLEDSLPAHVVEEMRRRRPGTLEEEIRWQKRIESLLDQGMGCCALGRDDLAEVVLENWRHFDGARYKLLAWVIMPKSCARVGSHGRGWWVVEGPAELEALYGAEVA